MSHLFSIFATDNPIISDYLYILKKFLSLVSLGLSKILKKDLVVCRI